MANAHISGGSLGSLASQGCAGGHRGGKAVVAWFLHWIIIPTAFSAGYGASPAQEIQHHTTCPNQYEQVI